MLLAALFGSLPALASPADEDGSLEVAGGELHQLSTQSAGQSSASVDVIGAFGGRDPQIVFGPDERMQIEDTTQDPYKKIAHLIAIGTEQGIAERCTGTFIGVRVIMTAAHCVWRPDFDGYPDTLEVIPGRNGDQMPYGSGFATNVWVPQGWIDSLSDGDLIPDFSFDYALVLMADDSWARPSAR